MNFWLGPLTKSVGNFAVTSLLVRVVQMGRLLKSYSNNECIVKLLSEECVAVVGRSSKFAVWTVECRSLFRKVLTSSVSILT